MNDTTQIQTEDNPLGKPSFFRCNRPELNVVCILDSFSYECFKFEANFTQIHSDSWKEQIKLMSPHFLFVESAINTTWQAVLFREDHILRKELYSLVAYCKENKIPTVFWNKEDPVFFTNLIKSAKLFDYVFTTDENCINQYVKYLGHNRVYVLPFAAQPALHNPVKSSYIEKQNVAFAGTWYRSRFLERQRDMHLLLNPAREFGLHIFDRMYNFTKHENYKFPNEYKPYIIGELDYLTTSETYKRYKIFLNVNSVKNSPTMFSRRVFEILASGTNVVSTYSKGIENFFGNIVLMPSNANETREHLSFLLNNPEQSQRLSLLGIREVHKNHVYRHRFNTILEKINLQQFQDSLPKISVLAVIDRTEELNSLLETYKNQTWSNKELILLTKMKSTESWLTEVQDYHNISIFTLHENDTENDLLNFGVNMSKGDYISIWDSSSYYAPFFLMDLAHAFNYTDADIVGKACYFSFSVGSQELIIRNTSNENCYVNNISYGSAIIKKCVFLDIQFSSNWTYPDFLRECLIRGFRLYSADKYNFVELIQDATHTTSMDLNLGQSSNYKYNVTV